MSVIIEKSVCKDCSGRDTCQRLKRLNPGDTIRDGLSLVFEGIDVGFKSEAMLYANLGRKREVFKIIITECSMKEQYTIRKKKGILSDEEREKNSLYYCAYCKVMHKNGSVLGKLHKSISDNIVAANCIGGINE